MPPGRFVPLSSPSIADKTLYVRRFNRMTRLAPILIVLLVAAHVAVTQSDAVSADEYSVYSALINARFIKPKTDFAIIQAQTGLHLGGGGAKELEDLLWAQNKKSYSLERRFDIRVKYQLLDDRQFEQTFGKDVEALDKGWNQYWTQHPHSTGLLTLSRVAFKPDTGEAILFASEVCGGLCGYGYFFRLKKDQGTWKIVEERFLWIS